MHMRRKDAHEENPSPGFSSCASQARPRESETCCGYWSIEFIYQARHQAICSLGCEWLVEADCKVRVVGAW